MTESRPAGREQGALEVEEHETFDKYEELEQFAQRYGVGTDTPKNILYAFKDGIDTPRWEDRAPRHISDPCTLSALLERLADIGVFTADSPNDFTVGLVLRLKEEKQLAIKYTMEECELTHPVDQAEEAPDRDREFDYIFEYEAVICSDHTKLFWDGRSLTEN